MHRFFEPQKITINQILTVTKDNHHKIKTVLKLKIHDKIIIFNNTNIEFIAQIINLENIITVKIISSTLKDLNSPVKIHLIAAITKHDNMDLVIQKTVELGVDQITPFISERTIVKPKNYSNKIDHWEKIAIAACCQSGRNSIPKINAITTFNEILQAASTLPHYHKIILNPCINRNYNSPKVINYFVNLTQPSYPSPQAIMLLTGPEGGFTSAEVTLAHKNCFIPLALGPRILRAETAAITIVAVIQAILGDW